MQTFENATPALKTVLPNEVYGAATTHSEGNRQKLVTLGFPLALVVAFGLFSLLQRSVHGFGENPADLVRNAQEVVEASGIAGDICEKLTGQGVDHEMQVTEETAYSKRRHSLVREWVVLCNTANGQQYLVRINSRTQQISAVNRLDTVAQGKTAATPADATMSYYSDSECSNAGVISTSEAELAVHHYLALAGIPEEGLEPVSYDDPETSPHFKTLKNRVDFQTALGDEMVRCYSYRRYVPGVGYRLIKISIDLHTGELVHLWNPVAAL